MASPNKVTAVHISLIIFVMITIILGVVTYIFLNEGRELRAEVAKLNADAQAQRNANVRYASQIDALKTLLGRDEAEVGDAATPNTVAGELAKQLSESGANLQPGVENSVNAHLRALRARLDALSNENMALNAKQTAMETELQTLRNQYSAEVAQYRDATDNANRDLVSRAQQGEEIVKQREADIARLQTELAQVSNEYDQMRAEYHEFREQSKQREDNLVRINNRLRERYEDATRLSFEVADGQIQYVDQRTQLAYISLGEADHLPLRTTFSVYRKNHQGVGRGAEDVKGAIEVTRIVGPHLAEARITDQDYYSPIAPGDPIYSPLWEVGRSHKFAVVGTIDIDGDGESDRDLFHQIVQSAGAEIQHEVNDEGERNPPDGRIDDTTKFLIVGRIPDPAVFPTRKEQEAALAIGEWHQKMLDEARQHGVRVVTLQEFLNFMGYKPRRRVWRPGEDRAFPLESGMRRTGVIATPTPPGRGTPQQFGRFQLQEPNSAGRNGSYQNGR